MFSSENASCSRVLILGSRGFIGSNVTKHLLKFHENVKFNIWDRRKHGTVHNKKNIEKVFEELSPKVVINCSWLSTEEADYKHLSENVRWESTTINLHESAMKRNIRIYSIGTGAETDFTVENQYVNSKRRTSHHLVDHGLLEEACWIRPTYIFSWADQRPHILRDACLKTQVNSFELLEPEKRNDFIHINDVVSGILHCTETKKTGIFEMRSGILMKNQEFLGKALAEREFLDPEDECHYQTWQDNHFFWNPKFTSAVLC